MQCLQSCQLILTKKMFLELKSRYFSSRNFSSRYFNTRDFSPRALAKFKWGIIESQEKILLYVVSELAVNG